MVLVRLVLQSTHASSTHQPDIAIDEYEIIHIYGLVCRALVLNGLELWVIRMSEIGGIIVAVKQLSRVRGTK